jgi:hypothetical protein
MTALRVGVAAAAAAAIALAPVTAHGESRYSLRGDGEPVASMRADARARGGAEAAAKTPSLSGNPASLVFADRTLFYGTYDTEWIRTEETLAGGNAVRKEYAGLVPNLGLVFPLPRGFTFGTGLLVARRRGGTIEQSASVDDGSGGSLLYRQEFEGRGSEVRVPLLLARDIGGVQAGTGLELLLLSAEQRFRNDFDSGQEDLGFVDSEDSEELGSGGLSWRAGVRVPLGEAVALGGWLRFPGKLNGERTLASEQAGEESDVSFDADVELPRAYAAGFEVRPKPGLLVAGDWTREAWDEVEPLTPVDRFVNVDRLALGAEWSRGAEHLAWPIRVGWRTEKLHVLDANGREVREHVLSAGSGFGIAGGLGTLDWYVEYGWRGKKDETEFLEHVVRFGVTLTGVEQWSRRPEPKEEDDW